MKGEIRFLLSHIVTSARDGAAFLFGCSLPLDPGVSHLGTGAFSSRCGVHSEEKDMSMPHAGMADEPSQLHLPFPLSEGFLLI